MPKQYVYEIHRKQALVTEVGSDPVPFTTKFMNELGRKGALVINMSEHAEPSGIKSADGREIPYYVVVVLTATEVEYGSLPRLEVPEEIVPEPVITEAA